MLTLLSLAVVLVRPVTVAVPDTTHCTAAASFLRETQRMQALVEPDTINDWRTQQRLTGCRITAAGGTTQTLRNEAISFYDRLRAAKWVRTPDPRDAPTESSLRFRWEKSDCLFNVTRDAMLFTDAEAQVNEALLLKSGENRYHVFVMCTAALPATTRKTLR